MKVDFTIKSDYFTSSGIINGIVEDDFPATGSATVDISVAGYTLENFSLQIGSHTLTTADFDGVVPFSSSQQSVAGFVFSKDTVSVKNQLVVGLASDYLGNFALVQAGSVLSPQNDAKPSKESVFSCVRCVASTSDVVIVPSPVPLPSSAPLLGAALLGLGILRYGMKGSKSAV